MASKLYALDGSEANLDHRDSPGLLPVQTWKPPPESRGVPVVLNALKRITIDQNVRSRCQSIPKTALFGSARDKVVYHFEGFGGDLRSSPINLAFDDSLDHLGWRLVSVRLHLQSDSSSCGIWIQVARDCWLEYVASTEHGNAAFASFIEERLKGEGVQGENGLKGTALSKARKANEQYMEAGLAASVVSEPPQATRTAAPAPSSSATSSGTA